MKSEAGGKPFVWTAFEGGNHMATWIYSHGVKAHYEWLLSQTQETIEERGSGSGNYVIVEIDTESGADSVGVIQRTTIRTDEAIATATAKLYK